MPDYGLNFVEIGDPGNRPVIRREAPQLFPPLTEPAWRIGRVPYRYRITRTEVTVSQWFEFVEAYAPFWQGSRTASEFTGNFIRPRSTNPNEPPDYFMQPGSEDFPTNMGWRVAARYCNWLHHDRVNEPWAFETGAYDTSTFTTNPNGTVNDQPRHSPGAKFWIPTNDEWTKALFYDPDRYGASLGGYWLYPHRSDIAPVPGLPGTPGAQTNAGEIPNDPGLIYPVGSYPDVFSPWGLFDGSGGVSEWTEHINVTEPRARTTRGSYRFGSGPEFTDRLDRYTAAPPRSSFFGMRMASLVPSPGCPALFLSLTAYAFGKRRTRSNGVMR